MHVDIDRLSYLNPFQILATLFHLVSNAYKAYCCLEMQYHFKQQLKSHGDLDLDGLVRRGEERTIERFQKIVEALATALVFTDRPLRIQDSTSQALFSITMTSVTEKYIIRAAEAVLHTPLQEDPNKLYQIVRRGWINLPEFVDRTIAVMVDTKIEILKRHILRKYCSKMGNDLTAYKRLWEAGCQRWPHIRDIEVYPNQIPNYLISLYQREEDMTIHYPGTTWRG